MAFCIDCGEKLVNGAKFCSNCGASAASKTDNDSTKRKQVIEGVIHKCPSCGDVLDSFVANCPACGYELRGAKITSSVHEFALRLEKAATEQQRINLICAFPIPNTKEDIFEFMLLASSNLDVINNASQNTSHLEIFNAWFSKIELCYQKAKLVLMNDFDFPKIQEIYDRMSKKNDEMNKVLRGREQEISSSEFRKGKFSKVILVFTTVFLIMCIFSFSNHNIWAGIITMIQTILFAVSWLVGMQFIKERKKHIHMIFVIIGFLLIIPFVFSNNSFNSTINPNYDSTYTWPNSELSRQLPQPESNKGEIAVHHDAVLMIYLYDISQEQFEAYVEDCIAKGFVIDSKNELRRYDAYNQNGYKLDLLLIDNELRVTIDAPIEMKEFQWPKSEFASLLPVPESNIGNIKNDTEKWFEIYVGETSKKQYDDYVDKCWELGFNISHSRSEDSFSAQNKNGYKIRLEYEYFSTMYISISNW